MHKLQLIKLQQPQKWLPMNVLQKLLGLGKDQSISDIQASALKAQGLITDTEEKVITTLNSTEKGAIGTINAHLERQQNEINSTESAMLKGLIDSGIIQKIH